MDYKYIEQLLERYWQGNTTLQEEAILRSFYNQLASSEASSDIPDDIRQYQPLFAMEQETPLGEDFDERILQLTEDAEPQRAKMVILVNRLKPLFKAAAIVAILLTLGNAAQVAFNQPEAPAVAGYQQQSRWLPNSPACTGPSSHPRFLPSTPVRSQAVHDG